MRIISKGQYLYRSILILILILQKALASEIDNVNLQVTRYIDKSWSLLTRDNWVQSSEDPKLLTDELIVYLPKKYKMLSNQV